MLRDFLLQILYEAAHGSDVPLHSNANLSLQPLAGRHATDVIRWAITQHVEWQIRHISSHTWTRADTILDMAEAIRQAQQRHAERQAKEASRTRQPGP